MSLFQRKFFTKKPIFRKRYFELLSNVAIVQIVSDGIDFDSFQSQKELGIKEILKSILV